jgi:hypothetical protein
VKNVSRPHRNKSGIYVLWMLKVCVYKKITCAININANSYTVTAFFGIRILISQICSDLQWIYQYFIVDLHQGE